MEYIEKALYAIIFACIAVGVLTQYRLHKYVSREKIMQAEDVTKLWKNCIPPKSILSDTGLKYHKLFNYILTLAVSCFFILFVSSLLEIF